MGVLWRAAVVFVGLVVLAVPVLSQAGPFGAVELLLLPAVAVLLGWLWYRASLRANVRRSRPSA